MAEETKKKDAARGEDIPEKMAEQSARSIIKQPGPSEEDEKAAEERGPTIDDLKMEVHAAEAHESLAHQRQLEEYQEAEKRERELQGEEIADEARGKLKEEEEKIEKAYTGQRGGKK
jgi:hypothetical protein